MLIARSRRRVTNTWVFLNVIMKYWSLYSALATAWRQANCNTRIVWIAQVKHRVTYGKKNEAIAFSLCVRNVNYKVQKLYTVIPRLTKIIRSGITFVSRNVIIRRLTSRCLERKQPSRVGGSLLCDVVSSFLCHTHTDGKVKLLEWPDRSCLLLYVSVRIH